MTTRKLQLNNKSNDYSSSLIEREDSMNTIHINDVGANSAQGAEEANDDTDTGPVELSVRVVYNVTLTSPEA